MSFLLRNYPQQKKNSAVDDRQCDPAEFEKFNNRWNFTIDAAAADHNAMLDRYWTEHDDALAQDWCGERVWCNPPYSWLEPWLEKASRRDADVAVLLLPANRTEQKWWQMWVEPARLSGEIDVFFLPNRIRFKAATDKKIQPKNRPPFGSCLVVYECGAPISGLRQADLFR